MKMKWIMIFAAMTAMTTAGCATAKKQPTTSTPAPVAQSTPAPAAKTPAVAPGMEKITCTKDAETRTLVVVAKGTGCVLNYDKDGKMSEPSSSTHSTAHCIQSEKKIRTKLEASGFKCS